MMKMLKNMNGTESAEKSNGGGQKVYDSHVRAQLQQNQKAGAVKCNNCNKNGMGRNTFPQKAEKPVCRQGISP